MGNWFQCCQQMPFDPKNEVMLEPGQQLPQRGVPVPRDVHAARKPQNPGSEPEQNAMEKSN